MSFFFLVSLHTPLRSFLIPSLGLDVLGLTKSTSNTSQCPDTSKTERNGNALNSGSLPDLRTNVPPLATHSFADHNEKDDFQIERTPRSASDTSGGDTLSTSEENNAATHRRCDDSMSASPTCLHQNELTRQEKCHVLGLDQYSLFGNAKEGRKDNLYLLNPNITKPHRISVFAFSRRPFFLLVFFVLQSSPGSSRLEQYRLYRSIWVAHTEPNASDRREKREKQILEGGPSASGG
ncbi:hypothetical protein CPC08DRAFT_729784 [Agrocybe pediades]|nr:hypothetical protein CPC08DRAFT_729784 [Agrocybe pediades]